MYALIHYVKTEETEANEPELFLLEKAKVLMVFSILVVSNRCFAQDLRCATIYVWEFFHVPLINKFGGFV